jgi:hypothetical protein
VIPVATEADRRQLDALIPLLNGRACVVVGSAPRKTPVVDLFDGEVSIAVNGGISSLTGEVDLWVVGSKPYDVSETSGHRQRHRDMLDQCRKRVVKRALFLRQPKAASEPLTLERLQARDCVVRQYSCLDKPTKRWLEGEYCGRKDDKQPCSSGVLAAAIALWCGAASVRLEGFSLKPGYHYLPKVRPEAWWRNHIDADRRALRLLRQRFHSRIMGDIFRDMTAKTDVSGLSMTDP